ncbi:MAG: YcxB family protein [Burkholderiales bacterium]|jgi:hypothetical protein|nr:YcxB family protein [Burkholderiales bacterium]
MSHKTTLIFSEQIIRQAAFGFLRRSLGVGFTVALVVVALSFGLLVVQGTSTWHVGMLGSILFMGIVSAVALYFVHYRSSLRRFREMGDPQATFHVDESTFTITSAIGSGSFQWLVVKELWRFSDVWLLMYSKAQFSILPLRCLSPEMQTFIVQRIQSAGGKIVG